MKQWIKSFLIMSSAFLCLTSIAGFADDFTSVDVAPPVYQVPIFKTPNLDQGTSNAQMQQFSQNSVANYLPISTPELTLGDVKSQAMNNSQLIQPIFLIGSDDRSQTWLKQNGDQLKHIHAIGLLIQASTPNDIQTVQALGNGLTIIPVSAKELIKRYGLVHYPVLITREGITQ